MSAPGDELDYGDIPDRIALLAERLEAHGDPDVVATAGELLDWIDAFHLAGLSAFVTMVREWRGETFLEHASQHPVVGLLLAGYGLGVDSGAASPDASPNDVRSSLDSLLGGPFTPSPASAVTSVPVKIGRKPPGP